MSACVIMHNIIVEDARDDSIYDGRWQFQGELIEPKCGQHHLSSFSICIMGSQRKSIVISFHFFLVNYVMYLLASYLNIFGCKLCCCCLFKLCRLAKMEKGGNG
jgi:hypothetical protein